jgi:hypothetical protein
MPEQVFGHQSVVVGFVALRSQRSRACHLFIWVSIWRTGRGSKKEVEVGIVGEHSYARPLLDLFGLRGSLRTSTGNWEPLTRQGIIDELQRVQA